MSIEDLQEEIEELKQERDELQDELDNHSDELSCRENEGYDRAMAEMEKKIESAFYGGWQACSKRDSTPLKAFLNYQMEQRL